MTSYKNNKNCVILGNNAVVKVRYPRPSLQSFKQIPYHKLPHLSLSQLHSHNSLSDQSEVGGTDEASSSSLCFFGTGWNRFWWHEGVFKNLLASVYLLLNMWHCWMILVQVDMRQKSRLIQRAFGLERIADGMQVTLE